MIPCQKRATAVRAGKNGFKPTFILLYESFALKTWWSAVKEQTRPQAVQLLIRGLRWSYYLPR